MANGILIAGIGNGILTRGIAVWRCPAHPHSGAKQQKKRSRDNETALFQQLQANYKRLEELEKVRDDLLAIGPTITHVGALGLAVTMKIATNLGLAVQMLAFSEAVALAEKAGIVRERAVEVLLKSVIASPMVKYRGPFVLGMPAEALFKVDMIQKDLGLALEMGKALGVPLPSVALTDELMNAARGLDLADYDFAVVFDVIARMSGLRPSVKTRR